MFQGWSHRHACLRPSMVWKVEDSSQIDWSNLIKVTNLYYVPHRIQSIILRSKHAQWRPVMVVQPTMDHAQWRPVMVVQPTMDHAQWRPVMVVQPTMNHAQWRSVMVVQPTTNHAQWRPAMVVHHAMIVLVICRINTDYFFSNLTAIMVSTHLLLIKYIASN